MTDQTPERKRFDITVYDSFRDMGEQLLAEVPELESVAFVMAWNVPQDGHSPQESLRPAIFMARGGKQSPKQILVMIDRFLRGLEFEINQLGSIIEGVDHLSKQLGKQVSEHESRLAELEAAIAAKAATLEHLETAIANRSTDLLTTSRGPHAPKGKTIIREHTPEPDRTERVPETPGD